MRWKSAVKIALELATARTQTEAPRLKTWEISLATRSDRMACTSLAGPSTGISVVEETLGRSHQNLPYHCQLAPSQPCPPLHTFGWAIGVAWP